MSGQPFVVGFLSQVDYDGYFPEVLMPVVEIDGKNFALYFNRDSPSLFELNDRVEYEPIDKQEISLKSVWYLILFRDKSSPLLLEQNSLFSLLKNEIASSLSEAEKYYNQREISCARLHADYASRCASILGDEPFAHLVSLALWGGKDFTERDILQQWTGEELLAAVEQHKNSHKDLVFLSRVMYRI